MKFQDWLPHYERILADFGFSRTEDERAAEFLANIIKDPMSEQDLCTILRDETVAIIGPNTSSKEIREAEERFGIIIATDSSVKLCMESGCIPHLIATDLDGDMDFILEASEDGAICIVHAHGDNVQALQEYVPLVKGRMAGTTQSTPMDTVHNFGGFTDGDRAVFMAEHCGAKSITLFGFDFERPVKKPSCDLDVKKKKLGWARYLIEKVIGSYDIKV